MQLAPDRPVTAADLLQKLALSRAALEKIVAERGLLTRITAVIGAALAQGNVTLQIRVTDVNEAPYFSVLPSGYRLAEESPVLTRAVPTTAGALGGNSIVVNDEDFGNNSALIVTCVSSSTGFGEAYFEVGLGVGGARECERCAAHMLGAICSVPAGTIWPVCDS